MGSKKTEQKTTNTYGHAPAPPPNPYFNQAASLIDAYDGGAAGIREGAMRNVNDINESGNEFLGASTPADVRDKVRQSRLFSNNLHLGGQLADAKQNEIAYKNAGYMSLGGATAPQLVQLSGDASTTQHGGVLAGMAQQAAAGVGQGLAA